METPIVQFNGDFYIPYIQKLVFHLPPVHILVDHNCGKELCD